MKYDQLEKLNSLREKGAITEEEYQKEKEKLLNAPHASSGDLLGMDEKTYCMVIHLSQFLGFIVPLLGLIAPVVLWAINKDKSRNIDLHGRIVLNWILSVLIYSAICFILTFIFIGIPLFVALAVMSVVFIILGAIRANEGVAWKYPLSIEFFKTAQPPSDYIR